MTKDNIHDWDTTPANNSELAGIDMAENNDPAGINNFLREMVSQLRKAFLDMSGKLVSGGSANAQTLTTNSGVTAYADGMMFGFIAGYTNTGAATLNVDAQGTKAIRRRGDVALAAGDITAGMPCRVVYDASANGAAGAWMLENPATIISSTALALVGTIFANIELRDVADTVNARGSISGAQTIDYTLGGYVTATITGSTTFTFSNPSASGKACAFTLEITNGGSNVTWPASVEWAGSSAPTLTASGTDIIVFMTRDGGTKWRGAVVGQDFG